MNIGKLVGSIMILVGTTIGAGILEFPTVSAIAGFTWAAILMMVMGILTTITGLMIIEVNFALPSHACGFSSMAEKTLGTFGKVVTWISYSLLLYSVTAAYIAGGTSVLTATIENALHLNTPSWSKALLFTSVLGLPVFMGTKFVDYFNRGLMSLKGILLLTTLALILPHVDITKLTEVYGITQVKYLGVVAPIYLLSLFYHSVIPSLRIYIGDKPQELKKAVIYGAVFCLIVYILWIIAALGTVPLTGNNSFTSWARSHGSVGEFINIMTTILHNKWIVNSIAGFSNITMTTSFLGVTLGLFDFLADGFKLPNTKTGRLKTAGLTFIPPIIFVLFFPKGFSMALNYAAIFIAIISFILPPLMIYRMRKNPEFKSQYRMPGGNVLFATVLIIGIILVVLPILSNLHLLPSIHTYIK